jgi:predicted transcriptional regulator
LKKKNKDYKNTLAGQAATKYLQELEDEGKIEQDGKERRSVYYRLKG